MMCGSGLGSDRIMMIEEYFSVHCSRICNDQELIYSTFWGNGMVEKSVQIQFLIKKEHCS